MRESDDVRESDPVPRIIMGQVKHPDVELPPLCAGAYLLNFVCKLYKGLI